MGISVDRAVIAKLVRSGEKFEVLVDPEKALLFKQGKDFSPEELFATKDIYEDSKKGLRASGEKINKAFGSTDPNVVGKRIVKEGDVQLTTEQRRKMIEDKTKLIATMISRKGINPQTNTPHPSERVLRAMEEAKARVELEKSAEEQVDQVAKTIQRIIPIRFEMVELNIKVPAEFAGRAPSVIKSFGSVSRDQWMSDGSYIAVIEIPAGLQTEVFKKLNDLTHGKVEVKINKRGM